MRRWISRAQELDAMGVDGKEDSPAHARDNLAKKNLRLFHEMIVASGSPDVGLASNIACGFDLMGDIPVGSIYPGKATHATLLPQQVREMSSTARAAIWEATKRAPEPMVAEEVYKITMEERDRGWLRGPLSMDQLPQDAVLSRRFGVKQTSTLADGSRITKVRPIDDFSESLVNSTNSCKESIQPMGVDAILAALAFRDQAWGREELRAKTIDLRKAYKNLPLSEEATRDAYLCVLCPTDGQPRAFQTLVLPFGARAAVMGFCRTSYAIWRIGVSIFALHWTVFFDDYYLVASSPEIRHVDMAQQLLFRLLGWETSSEKEGDFLAISKILGVQIDLNESRLGRFAVSNVEARVKELVASIDAILSRGTLAATEMRALRGRLVFAEAQIYGRLAGLHMQHLGRWEHAMGETAVDVELRASLEFIRDRVICGEPRMVDASHGRVFHLYTDACYEDQCGGVGGVLIDGSGTMLSYFSAQISRDQAARLNPLNKDTIIFELEALAAWLGGHILLPSAAIQPNDRVVVFLDNDGVLGRIISGKSGLGLDGAIINGVLEWEYSLKALVWYERVPSAANIADPPSRGELAGFRKELRVELDIDCALNELLDSSRDA